MEQNKKVSVIVPCYNSAKYLNASLKSLFDQYYENIEIVCVNDGSTDSTAAVLSRMADEDERVKIVTLSKNSGLFNARIQGVKNSSGDYLMFMDSDDFVTRNWVGALLDKAEETKADLVFGDMRKKGKVPQKEIDPEKCCFYNLDPIRLSDFDNSGEEIFDLFMKNHGLCSHYHYVWNKLIRRDLWQKCEADFETFLEKKGHLVMGEDIAFSLTLLLFAKHITNVHHQYYIYCIHDNQSVNTDSLKKFQKNVDDLLAVFDYFKNTLVKYGVYEKYAQQYLLFKQRYGMIYYRLARELSLPKKVISQIEEDFAQDKIKNINDIKSEQFVKLMTNVSDASVNGYDEIVDRIFSDDIKVVSFDVFDTLVFRPFARPADVFLSLNKPFSKVFETTSMVDFSGIRRHAEQHCHKLQKALKPGIEEPTLEEIYDTVSLLYGYDREKLRIIENIEIENEIKFAYPRKSAVQLFDMAKKAGKHVIVASDMYLPKSCIEKILAKCGVEGYEKLYLSSEMHLTKHSGRMFPAIISDLKEIAQSNQILHIGDNTLSDIENSQQHGIIAAHYPKAIDLFLGRNAEIFSGESFFKMFYKTDRYVDMEVSFHGYTGLRCLLAVAANKTFDFPFVSFNKDSDFNADPNYIGYYAVGMHIFAVARWLIQKTRGKGIGKIHFAARDGYLIKKAYDILTQNMSDVPTSSYFRASRKAFAIADIKSFNDLHSLIQKLNFASQTPDSIFDLFSPVMSEQSKLNYENYRKNNIQTAQAHFCEIEQFSKFLTDFYKTYLYDADFECYQNKLKRYFEKTFAPEDVFFDIGYSGRIELVLSKLLGRKIKSFYIHSNNEYIEKRAAVADIENETFYDYKPVVTGVIREHILSELAPSTIGYEFVGDDVLPVFDEFDMNYPTVFVTQLLQKSALQFVSDVHDFFGDEAVDLFATNMVLSRPFEYFMHAARLFDRKILSDLEFEDDLGEGHAVSGMEFWDRNLQRIFVASNFEEPEIPSRIVRKPLFMRALYFLLFDRKNFVKKLKKRFRRLGKKKRKTEN